MIENFLQKISNFKRDKELKQIFSNTGWLFAERIVRMGFVLFISIWVARYLGVKQFGELNYALAFVALFGIFSTLGLPSLVVRTITENPEQKNTILGTTFILYIIGSTISFLLTIVAIFLLSFNDNSLIQLVTVLAFTSILKSVDTIDLWFRSQVLAKYIAIAKTVSLIITSLYQISLIYLHAPIIAFAWSYLLEAFLGGICLIVLYQLQGNSFFQWHWDFSLAKKLLKESWPLILSSLSIMIYMKLDQIMLGLMIDQTAVGWYSSAAKISEAFYFIPTAIISSFSPSIYRLKKTGDKESYCQYITKLLKGLNIIAILIVIPTTLFPDIICNVLFGKEFIGASPILMIHIWALPFVFMGVGTSPWFIAEGLTQEMFQRTFIGAIANVILNFLLIPKYSGVGAAIATVIAYSMAAFFAHAIYPKSRPIFLIQLKSFW